MRPVRFIALLLLTAAAPAAQAKDSSASIPDLSGMWARKTFAFERPLSGPGPIGRYSRQPNTGGNINNTILQPEAAANIGKSGETLRSGEDYTNPTMNC